MAFIDWSDPEEMFGLLCEYVADERAAAAGDPPRRRFLADLEEELEDLAEQFGGLSQAKAIDKLQALQRSQPIAFARDSVLQHLGDCIDQLERIRKDRSG